MLEELVMNNDEDAANIKQDDYKFEESAVNFCVTSFRTSL